MIFASVITTVRSLCNLYEGKNKDQSKRRLYDTVGENNIESPKMRNDLVL